MSAVASYQGAPELKPLTPKQRAFAIEFVRLQDAEQAARNAGYSAKGIKGTSWHLLQRPDVNAAIDALLYSRVVRAGITADRILNEIATIAFDRSGAIETKDRLNALDKLARASGVYNDRLTIDVSRETLEQAAKDAGVTVEAIEAEYRLLGDGKDKS